MVTEVTAGIRISVETSYKEKHSNPRNSLFLFSYHIAIENMNDYPVQLLSRSWEIFDSNGDFRTVSGDGVVGQQPIIEPCAAFFYDSACNLNSDIGKMKGFFTFIRLNDNITIDVCIPEFLFSIPYRLN